MTRFLYARSELIGEYGASGTLQRRYVHGAGIDEPVVWYEGAGTADRRWLVADERASVVAVTDRPNGEITYKFGTSEQQKAYKALKGTPQSVRNPDG